MNNRRQFITLLGGAAAWPLAARAQQPAMPVIGFLSSQWPGSFSPYVTAFRQGLKETGQFDGQDLTIEYRWAEGQFDRLPALVTELVRRQVSVLLVSGGTGPMLAAKAAATTIPIVFVTADDPVATGFVASLSRPGGDMTGVSFISIELLAKRLEMLCELVPKAAVIPVLANPNNPTTEPQIRVLQEAANTSGKEIHVLNARTERDIDTAFANLIQMRNGALLIANDLSH